MVVGQVPMLVFFMPQSYERLQPFAAVKVKIRDGYDLQSDLTDRVPLRAVLPCGH
jgi:hypothetical protein